MGIASCKKDKLPTQPVVDNPISALIITINGTDYTAQPQINTGQTINDTLLVKVPNKADRATIKKLVLKVHGASASIKEGDLIMFQWDMFSFSVNVDGTEHTYYLNIQYTKTEPDFVYIVKQSDDYIVNSNTRDRLVSVNNDHKYEGYIWLNDNDKGNIGIANSFIHYCYGTSAGFASSLSYSSFTLSANLADANNRCPIPGPFNNNWAAGSGVWKVNFDATNNKLEMLNTIWAMSGTAVGSTVKELTYNRENKLWELAKIDLDTGSFKFTTIPLTPGDPIITYGKTGGSVSQTGTDITVDKAGFYTVSLDLSTPGEYKYTLTALDQSTPEYSSMYLVSTGEDRFKVVTDATPQIYDFQSDGNFSGYVYLGDRDWQNLALVTYDQTKYYTAADESSDGIRSQGKYGSFVLNEAPYSGAGDKYAGPWAQWNIGAAVWKIDFNTVTKAIVMILADWNITGTATGNVMKNMSYDKVQQQWIIDAALSVGEFKFRSSPVSDGAQNFSESLGVKAGELLSRDGVAIAVSEAGNYRIVLDLSQPIYNYTMSRL